MGNSPGNVIIQLGSIIMLSIPMILVIGGSQVIASWRVASKARRASILVPFLPAFDSFLTVYLPE